MKRHLTGARLIWLWFLALRDWECVLAWIHHSLLVDVCLTDCTQDWLCEHMTVCGRVHWRVPYNRLVCQCFPKGHASRNVSALEHRKYEIKELRKCCTTLLRCVCTVSLVLPVSGFFLASCFVFSAFYIFFLFLYFSFPAFCWIVSFYSSVILEILFSSVLIWHFMYIKWIIY